MRDELVKSDEHISNVQSGLDQWRFVSLKLLGQTLDAYDERSPEDFADILEALLRNVFSQQEIASELKVSVATVSRWASGRTAPVPYARGVIVRRLRQMLNRNFAQLQSEPKRRAVLYPVTQESA